MFLLSNASEIRHLVYFGFIDQIVFIRQPSDHLVFVFESVLHSICGFHVKRSIAYVIHNERPAFDLTH